MSPVKRLVAMVEAAHTTSDGHAMATIEGYGVRLQLPRPPNRLRHSWIVNGKVMGFFAMSELLERAYRLNHPAPAKVEVIPPLPKGTEATDTCPVGWAYSDEQMLEYARAYHKANA